MTQQIIFFICLSWSLIYPKTSYGLEASPSARLNLFENCRDQLSKIGIAPKKTSLGIGQETIFQNSALVKVRVLEVGDSKPLEVALANGEHGVWKPKNEKNNPRHEVAAYAIDRLLGLGLVPLTVLREFGGQEGSLQYFVRGGRNPYETMSYASKTLRFLDLITANTDRHGDNFLILEDGSQVAIDNMKAFSTLDGELPQDWVLRQAVPTREIYERYKYLAERTIHQELDPLLGKKIVDKFIKRRDNFVNIVDRWVQKEGPENIFEDRK